MCVRQSNRSGNIRFIYREPEPAFYEEFVRVLRELSIVLSAGFVMGFLGVVLFVMIQSWAGVA